jgi:hypothetical protein
MAHQFKPIVQGTIVLDIKSVTFPTVGDVKQYLGILVTLTAQVYLQFEPKVAWPLTIEDRGRFKIIIMYTCILLDPAITGPAQRMIVVEIFVICLVQVYDPFTFVTGCVVLVVAVLAEIGPCISGIVLHPDPFSASAAGNGQLLKTIRTKRTISQPFHLRRFQFFPTSTAWYLLIHNITSNCIFVCSLDPIRPG